MSWLEKLKTRWHVSSIWQVLVILLVFACTGFSILYLKRFLNGLVGIDENTAGWIKIVFWILVIFPLYQVVLLFYGFLLGQFKFFWNFEKRMLRGIGSLFSGKSRDK